MEHTENQITVQGRLRGLPEYSHENHGRRFCRFSLEVPRLSGAVDTLPVVTAESLLDALPLQEDMGLRISGQIRSHNVRREDGRHLQIFLFAGQIDPEEGPGYNQVSIAGNLCRDPILRRTPLGRDICDVMLAVPRAFHRADYLPCILWGRVAQEASLCRTGDAIRIEGRLQSRSYTKVTDSGPVSKTAYEISAMTAQLPQSFF